MGNVGKTRTQTLRNLTAKLFWFILNNIEVDEFELVKESSRQV